MRDTTNAVLRGKILALNAYIRREKKFQINKLSTYLKNPVKKENNSQSEINKNLNRKPIEKNQ